MNRKAWIVAAACVSAASMAQAACFTVYKADGTLLQESSTTPVNLALPIGDTVPEKFGPGATMTVSEHNFFCPDRHERMQSTRKSLADSVRADSEKAPEMVIKRRAEAPDATNTAAR